MDSCDAFSSYVIHFPCLLYLLASLDQLIALQWLWTSSSEFAHKTVFWNMWVGVVVGHFDGWGLVWKHDVVQVVVMTMLCYGFPWTVCCIPRIPQRLSKLSMIVGFAEYGWDERIRWCTKLLHWTACGRNDPWRCHRQPCLWAKSGEFRRFWSSVSVNTAVVFLSFSLIDLMMFVRLKRMHLLWPTLGP